MIGAMKFWIALALVAMPAVAAEKTTLGFAVTGWNTAMHESKFQDECPEGMNPSNLAIFHQSLTPAQRRALPLVNATELRTANMRGRNGEDVCVYPLSVEDPPLRIVEGKYSYGLDLDGDATGAAGLKTCRHDNFTGVNDEPGIDNQMYRLFGCVYAWRSWGHIENNANAHRLAGGLGMVLIEISDVDDVRNDDRVNVGFYRGVDPFVLDSAGKVLPWSSYAIDAHNGRARYGDIVQGRIKDGVVTTETADVALPFFGNYQFQNQSVREMRLRLELSPDGGSAKGLVAGYYDVEQTYSYVRGMLGAFPNTQQFSCPGIYVAAHELADGHPDPDTGKCTTLSGAFKFESVAAFLNHPNAEKDVAAAP